MGRVDDVVLCDLCAQWSHTACLGVSPDHFTTHSYVCTKCGGPSKKNRVIDEEMRKYRHLDECIGFVIRSDCNKKTLDSCVCQNACDAECVNVKAKVQCEMRLCPFGGLCDNARFWTAKRPTPDPPIKLDIFHRKGVGARASRVIREGELVVEYVGRVLLYKDCEKNLDPDTYLMALQNGFVIDARKEGNLSRFINHSCKPNCIAQIWSVHGINRVGIFAVATICAGEEITFDYNLHGKTPPTFVCACDVCLQLT